jgi:hypothetical protein
MAFGVLDALRGQEMTAQGWWVIRYDDVATAVWESFSLTERTVSSCFQVLSQVIQTLRYSDAKQSVASESAYGRGLAASTK